MFVEFESPKISSSQVMTWSSQVTRTVLQVLVNAKSNKIKHFSMLYHMKMFTPSCSIKPSFDSYGPCHRSWSNNTTQVVSQRQYRVAIY